MKKKVKARKKFTFFFSFSLSFLLSLLTRIRLSSPTPFSRFRHAFPPTLCAFPPCIKSNINAGHHYAGARRNRRLSRAHN